MSAILAMPRPGIEAPTPSPAAAPAALELRGICKQFPGVRALDDVSFAVRAGEIHMLLGENGAGKSTLMKVLCGAYRADSGEYWHEGQRVEIGSPADARALGIAVIFQEFSLVPYLDIAQNIFLGREFRSRRVPGLIDRGRIRREAKRVLDAIGFDVDPRTPVHRLGVAQQQMVEIAKALSQDARILVMDEPTAALSDRETELLFAMMRKLQARGVGIVYISHRMAEVFALGDRITVLRDGRKVGEARPAETTPDALVRMMVGRAVDTTYPRRRRAPGEVVLETRGLTSPNGISDVSITVRAGEIVGLAGLVGSGRTEVARCVFGADPVSGGEIRLRGRPHRGGPDEAARAGIALIPESRKSEGLALIRTVGDNVTVAALPRLFPSGRFAPGRARRVAEEMIRRLRIATPSPRRPVGVLSGGNQQKVVIGKWLAGGAELLLFDEPTRGIDVGAKAEIFALIDELVQGGAAVLMISSEQAEIVHVCDRAYVMREGRVVAELARHELTEEAIVTKGMHHEDAHHG